MLNALETEVLLRAAAALRAQPATAALAQEIDNILLTTAKQRAAAGRPAKGRAGRPTLAYTVALEPGWQSTVQGSKGAAALVASTLKDLGLHGAPSAGSLAVSLSRNGHWTRVVETADGTAALTVRPVSQNDKSR